MIHQRPETDRKPQPQLITKSPENKSQNRLQQVRNKFIANTSMVEVKGN